MTISHALLQSSGIMKEIQQQHSCQTFVFKPVGFTLVTSVIKGARS